MSQHLVRGAELLARVNASAFAAKPLAILRRYLDDDGAEDRSLAYQRLVRELLEAQRREIVLLRNQGQISNQVMHRIERDLDLEDSRLEI